MASLLRMGKKLGLVGAPRIRLGAASTPSGLRQAIAGRWVYQDYCRCKILEKLRNGEALEELEVSDYNWRQAFEHNVN